MLGRFKAFWGLMLALVLSLSIVPGSFAAVSDTKQATTLAQQSSALSQDEIDGLLFTREEEKLARDVYLTLGAQWKLVVFSNISASEQKHMDAVKVLLDRYGLKDPVGTNAVGIFTNAQLQQWYTELVTKGSVSLSAALRAGGEIEERDILDLQGLMAQTNKADLDRLYANLLFGSKNHLRAFVTTLKNQTGETYVPQYLSKAEYQAIMDGSNGRGGPRRRGRR